MDKLSQTLRLDLTLKDEELKPFWNEVSQEIHALLWQPRKTESLEQDLVSSNILSNYQEVKSDFWKKMYQPNNSIPKRWSHLLRASLIHTTANALHNETVITSKKIRIFPKNKNKFIQAMHTYRRAYNLTIEAFKNNINPDSDLRRSICEKIKSESVDVYDVNLICEAYRKACITRNSIIKRRKAKLKAEYSFMSWKYSPKYFLINKLGKNGTIYLRSLGEVDYTESIPNEAINKSAVISFENNEWYACVQYHQTIKNIDSNDKSIIALDQGCRTFITAYSENQAYKYGESFAKDKLTKIALSVNKLISFRDILINKSKEFKKEDVPQWIKDRLTYCFNKLSKLKAKKQHLINDLHHRVAYDLVQNNDVILLPTFKTSRMVLKKDAKNRSRKLRKISVREMFSLQHYKFKNKLKWYAKKYGKLVLDVNEAYTSNTLWDGTILDNLGGQKEIKKDEYIVDRDLHGARNIFIRFLTKRASLEA